MTAPNAPTRSNAPRRMLSLEALSPSFRILADLSGKAPTADTMQLYAEHFADGGLMAEAVNQAVRRIAVEWDKPYWPSAEMIAQKARRLQRDVMDEIHGVRPRVLELDERAVDARERTWEERRQRAEVWFAAHAEHGRRLIAEADADIARIAARHPTGRMATDDAYRKAYREGAIISACLLELTRAVHPNAGRFHAEGRGEVVDVPALAA